MCAISLYYYDGTRSTTRKAAVQRRSNKFLLDYCRTKTTMCIVHNSDRQRTCSMFMLFLQNENKKEEEEEDEKGKKKKTKRIYALRPKTFSLSLKWTNVVYRDECVAGWPKRRSNHKHPTIYFVLDTHTNNIFYIFFDVVVISIACRVDGRSYFVKFWRFFPFHFWPFEENTEEKKWTENERRKKNTEFNMSLRKIYVENARPAPHSHYRSIAANSQTNLNVLFILFLLFAHYLGAFFFL